MTMRHAATLAILLSGLGACSPTPGDAAGGVNRHLECAAMISAASRLGLPGRLTSDPARGAAGLGQMMSHLTAYGIPNDLSEPEAFVALEAERERLIGSMEPARIKAEAQTCMGEAP